MVLIRILPCLLLVLAVCITDASSDQSDSRSFSYPSFGNSLRSSRAWDGAERRTIWARARSFIPRAVDVVGEAIGALLVPTLLVLGFKAVWPRRYHYDVKRSTDGLEPIEPMDALLGHLSTIYYAATESDICMQRIVCELGATTKDLKQGNKDLMISILGKAASKKYSKLFSKFSYGVNNANCKKIGCKLMD